MGRNDQDGYVEMPETYTRRQLNALYRAVPLKDNVFRQLRKYFNAMANLYGVISLRKAYQIISGQSPRLVTREEFLAFAEIARHECEEYYLLGPDDLFAEGKLDHVMDREIIDIALLDGDLDRYQELRREQEGKPFYIPPKASFFAYEDPFYCEPSKAVEDVQEFLTNRLRPGIWQTDDVLAELIYGVRCANAGLPQIMERLNTMGIRFSGRRDVQKLAELYQTFHNSMRMQCNRGFTPEELYAMQPPEERVPKAISFGPNIRKALADGDMDAQEMRQMLLSADLPSEELRLNLLKELADAVPAAVPARKVKIGRNDPCPCGSGKKYKKCCGR